MASALLKRRSMKSSLAFLVGASAFVVTSAAWAESAPAQPACQLRPTPAYDRTVPANAPALVVIDFSPATVKAGASVSSLTPSGPSLTLTPDTKSEGATLLLPQSSFAPSTKYTYDLETSCVLTNGTDASAPGYPRTEKVSFETVGEVALPTTIGTAQVREATADGTPVDITPSAELAAYLAVARFELWSDGKLSTTGGYGEFAANDGPLRFTLRHPYLQRSGQNVCKGQDGGTTTVTGIELRAHVAGAATDPTPLSFDATVVCPSRYDEPILSGGDGGLADGGRETDDRAATGGDDGGCQMGPGEPSGFALLGTFGTLAALALGRSRRKRRAVSSIRP
jgi:hypothetical protein